jgi:hypothetical protein
MKVFLKKQPSMFLATLLESMLRNLAILVEIWL